jgi:hypothetical protein
MTDNDDHPRKMQADAMAMAQAWGLVAHACAIHHGHPHATQMLADDIATLDAEPGAMQLVLHALGDALGEAAGHRLVIDAMRHRINSGEHVAQTVAVAMADAIGYDGERALSEQRACVTRGEFWALVCDAAEQLDDE